MVKITSVVTVLLLFINLSAYSQSGWIKTNICNRPLSGVHFINSNTGFILSNDSLFKTTDGGLNWTAKGTGSGSPVFTSLKVFDENNISIMGQCCYPEWNFGLIAKTSNGGNTWINSFFSPNQEILNAENTEWFDINTGISIWVDYGGSNYYGRIFRTTNSGSNWSEINYNISLGYFISVKYQNVDSIYGLTNISLYKSTNRGSNWFPASNLGVDVRTEFSCPGFDTMYIGGINMSRSVNRGMDFTNTFTLDTPYVVKDLEFINARTGFAIGSSTKYGVIKGGYIIKTTNAGINWTRQTSNTNIYISDIFFLNENTGWIVGDSGLVLRTTTGGTTFIKNICAEIPSEHSLSQNYPNPFNPETRIRYSIKMSAPVTLKVYDVLGKEVRTLVNENQAPGTYEAVFDASRIPSGVYYYRLTAEGYSETRKMVVIK